jgi:hypothetical protein
MEEPAEVAPADDDEDDEEEPSGGEEKLGRGQRTRAKV